MMNILLKTIAILSLSLVSSWCNAAMPKQHLILSLINKSNETLYYTGVTDSNEENSFLVSPKIVLPGGKITITSVTYNLNYADLSGNLHFQDMLGRDHSYHLSDPQQMHYKQTVFLMGNGRNISLMTHRDKPSLLLTD